MKRIQIDDDIQHFLLANAVDLGESPSSILRRALRLEPPADTVEIEDDVYRFLVSRAASLAESPSSILRRELALAPPGPGPGPAPAPAVVEFHIARGTGNRPWNAVDAPVTARVGDTLRLFNDDSVPHRLHTPGTPFPHPAADIPPGGVADFLLLTAFDPAVDGALHDHTIGAGAPFFLRVTAG